MCNRYHCVKVSKCGVISGPYLVTQCTPNGHIQQQLSNIFLGKLQNFQFPVFQKKCFLMELYSFRTSARNSIFSKDAGLSPETSLKLIHSTRVFTVFTHILFIQIFPTKRFWKFCALSEQLSRSQPWTTCIFTNQKNKTKQNKQKSYSDIFWAIPWNRCTDISLESCSEFFSKDNPVEALHSKCFEIIQKSFHKDLFTTASKDFFLQNLLY